MQTKFTAVIIRPTRKMHCWCLLQGDTASRELNGHKISKINSNERYRPLLSSFLDQCFICNVVTSLIF